MQERFIGEVIKDKRIELGIKQWELCEGICEPSTLSRIENQKQTPTRTVLKALLQRLGLNDERITIAVTSEEILVNELFKDITKDNIRYEKANKEDRAKLREAILERHNELRNIMDKDDHIIEQFLVRSEVIIGQYSFAEKLERLLYAMHLTHPRFELTSIRNGLFTYDELKIINQIANAYSESGDHAAAIKIWEDLLFNIDKRFATILPNRTCKELVLYGYSRELLIVEDYEKAYINATKGRLIAVENGLFQHLGGFIIIQAECEFQFGNKDVSKELFIDAYHLCRVIGDKVNEKIVKEAMADYFQMEC